MAQKSSLPAHLKRRAIGWAGQLTKLAKSNAPNHLKSLIQSKVEQEGESRFKIRIFVKHKATTDYKNGSADARAQEYGSGLWAQIGAMGWIPIKPKVKSRLAFPYPAEKVYPGTRYVDGKIITNQVMSPGIHAANNEQGYIRPAINEIRKRLRSELDDTIREAISFDMRSAFSGAKKK